MRVVRAVLFVALLTAAAVGAWRLGWRRLERRPKATPPPVAVARPTDFETTVLSNGLLEPAASHPIVSVDAQGRVQYIIDDGSLVKAGDIIIRIDTRDMQERLDSMSDLLQRSTDRLEQARTGSAREIENAKSAVSIAEQRVTLVRAQNAADLVRAQAELDQAQREQEYADGQLARMQRLFDQGLATREQLDQEKTSARQQQFDAEKANRALTNARREAGEKERSAQMELDKARLDLDAAQTGAQRSVSAAEHAVEAAQRQVNDLQRQIGGATLRTGVAGLVLLNNNWHDESGHRAMRVGDDVWPGVPIANVVDPAHVRVNCEIEETDIRRIRNGQKVTLRVGTAQGHAFPGSLQSIDNIATEAPWWSSRGARGRRTFSALIAVKSADRRLRPGTTAWLEIVVESAKQKLAIPAQAVFETRAGPVVYLKRGGKFEQVPVTLGPRNDLYRSVARGLEKGDQVALTRPPRELLVGAVRGPEKR